MTSMKKQCKSMEINLKNDDVYGLTFCSIDLLRSSTLQLAPHSLQVSLRLKVSQKPIDNHQKEEGCIECLMSLRYTASKAQRSELELCKMKDTTS